MLIGIEFIVDFAQKMLGWRRSRGLSQRAVSRETGIPQAAWCQYESVKRIPEGFSSIRRLIEVTASDPAHAITEDDFTPDAVERAKRRMRNKSRRQAGNAA